MSGRRGLRARFGPRPFASRLFWTTWGLSAAAGLLVGIIVGGARGVPDGPIGWSVPVLVAVFVTWIAFRILSIGIGMSRAWEESRHRPPPSAPSHRVAGKDASDAVDASARSLGAMVGRRLPRRPSR